MSPARCHESLGTKNGMEENRCKGSYVLLTLRHCKSTPSSWPARTVIASHAGAYNTAVSNIQSVCDARCINNCKCYVMPQGDPQKAGLANQQLLLKGIAVERQRGCKNVAGNKMTFDRFLVSLTAW